nr:serine/threonine-protein kinase TOR-like [Tanacetum cinerariifolium]
LVSTLANTKAQPAVNSDITAANHLAIHQLGDANKVLNECAVVMARMSNKLTGCDFSTCSSALPTTLPEKNSNFIYGDTREVDHGLSVKLQVQKQILQATSHENLCQNYVGWCPFW